MDPMTQGQSGVPTGPGGRTIDEESLDFVSPAEDVRGARYSITRRSTERTVILGPTATPHSVRGLRAARRVRGPMPAEHDLVLSRIGERVCRTTLHHQWAKLCRAAGLLDDAGTPRYTPHQLRHTLGSESRSSSGYSAIATFAPRWVTPRSRKPTFAPHLKAQRRSDGP